jgi:2-polyprenyl-3-methyl-5-hydroxy-6-metoxy-1,4-benzoquinol methylase
LRYTGIDNQAECVDALSLEFPEHRFLMKDVERDDLRGLDPPFDVITLIAVVEHLVNPAATLSKLGGLLAPNGRIILTAPRHGAESLYSFGVALGLFSKEAHDDHKYGFPGREFFDEMSGQSGLSLDTYRPFLWGFNQLVVFGKTQQSRQL